MQIGFIGLGKMGFRMVLRLHDKGHDICAFDTNELARAEIEKIGVKTFSSLENVAKQLSMPRVIWLMVPHDVVDNILTEIAPYLDKGDLLIDGGNSLYKDSMRRAKELISKGIRFVDVGVSGGPGGARDGTCLMIGGSKEDFFQLENLFRDLALESGYAYMGKHGAGHFVKMVHNAIEYGMMQAIAEGFTVMEKSEFELDLKKIADLYNHGSVIESRLIGWLKDAFEEFGQKMKDVSPAVARSGEGDWAIDVTKELGVFAPVLQSAVHIRKKSAEKPSYTGKLLTAMRNRFGGHSIK